MKRFEYTADMDLLIVEWTIITELKMWLRFVFGQALPVICTASDGREYKAWKLINSYKRYMLGYLKLT